MVPFYWDDFWPLSPHSLDNSRWIAWQFDRPEAGEGVVQAFRRGDSPIRSMRYKLRALDPAARYRITDIDAPATAEASGRELLESGLAIDLGQKPSAAIVFYKRIEQQAK